MIRQVKGEFVNIRDVLRRFGHFCITSGRRHSVKRSKGRMPKIDNIVTAGVASITNSVSDSQRVNLHYSIIHIWIFRDPALCVTVTDVLLRQLFGDFDLAP